MSVTLLRWLRGCSHAPRLVAPRSRPLICPTASALYMIRHIDAVLVSFVHQRYRDPTPRMN